MLKMAFLKKRNQMDILLIRMICIRRTRRNGAVIAVMSGRSSVRVVAQTLEIFQSALELDRDKALRFRPQNCAQSKQQHQIKMNTPKIAN